MVVISAAVFFWFHNREVIMDSLTSVINVARQGWYDAVDEWYDDATDATEEATKELMKTTILARCCDE